MVVWWYGGRIHSTMNNSTQKHLRPDEDTESVFWQDGQPVEKTKKKKKRRNLDEQISHIVVADTSPMKEEHQHGASTLEQTIQEGALEAEDKTLDFDEAELKGKEEKLKASNEELKVKEQTLEVKKEQLIADLRNDKNKNSPDVIDECKLELARFHKFLE